MSREVILYTRLDCGLCDETADELRRVRDDLRFTLTELDVDSDAGLRQRYNDVVPVVVVDGREIARAPIDVRALRANLSAALG